jgi:hypothetical protein
VRWFFEKFRFHPKLVETGQFFIRGFKASAYSGMLAQAGMLSFRMSGTEKSFMFSRFEPHTVLIVFRLANIFSACF